MRKTLFLALPAAVMALAGAAHAADPKAPEKPKRQCFWASQVSSFAAADENAVNVKVGVKDVYRLEMFAPCMDLDWNHAIGIRSRGSDNICTGFDAEIISPSTIGPQRCQVKSVRKLTEAEVAALPKRGRP